MSLEAALSGLVATGLPATDVCGAGSQIAGTSLLTFTGGTLAPNTSCTFAVTLQVPAGAATGTHANATSAVTATVAGSAVTSPPATDGLELALLTLSKAFTDDPVVAGPTVTLQFTLTNASPTTSATAIAFTDDLTDVLTGLVATGLPLNNACNGTGTLIGASGDTVLTFSGGTLAPGTSCTFGTTLTVPAGITPGAYPNTTAPGGATLGGAVTLPPATDALQIVEPLSITKAFTNDPVVPGGTVTLAFTITNAALQAATALAFTDDLGAALTGLVATGLPAADVCGAGSSIAGTSLLTFTGGSLGAGASCTFQVTLQVPAGLPFGTLATNTTSAVTGTVGGVGVTGDAATDTLVVNLLTFTKVFDGVKPPGATSTLTFTITNLNQAAGATGLRFTDDLSAALSGLVATGLPATAVCGAGSTITGTSFLTFEGGTLGPGGSCSVAVTLQVPVSALDGVHVNTTSLLSVGGLEAANPASAGLQVAGQADLSITKSDDPDPVLTGETLTYTVTVHNAGPHLAPNVVVTDTLPGGLTLVSTAGCAEDPAGVPSCSLGTIPVGGSAQYTITTTVNVGGTAAVTNQATVAANRADPDGANNTASEVTATPALCIITGPTAAATFTAESPFLALVGTCLANTVARGADASSAVTTVTWTNDRGGSGTATGTTNRSAPLVPLQPGTNQITVTGTTGGGRTDSATLTVTVSRLVYYLAEGATGPFFDLDLLLSNSNGTAAPVTITYLKEDGTTIVQAVTLAANSQQSIRVNDVPGLATSPVSIVVSSDSALPIAVERSMLWDASVPAPRGAVGPAIASGATHYGGHTAKAVDSPRTAWFFAEGSQGFFDTYLLLANANLTPATATVTYLLEGAAPVVQVVPVGPTSRVTLFAGVLPALVGRSFGIQVTATQPIIAERAMYFSAGRFWEGGHESAGVEAPATSWFLAEGATGPFFDNFVLVSNPNGAPANLTVTFLLDTGVAIPMIHQVPANARITINVETQHPQLATANVSTTVTSDIPVVAERAMYWTGGFTTWYEAHNSFGVTATGTKWGLAEGRVGTGFNYQTFILLANPSPTAVAVRITYLRTNGTTVVKSYTVGPTSRFNVWVNVQVPELVDEAFGALVEVTNGVEIAVERALYWDNGAQIWAVGTNATGTRLP